MNCGQTKEKLSAWLDGQLDPVQSSAVKDHLDRCAVCAAEAGQLSAVDRLYRSAPKLEPRFDFRSAVLCRVIGVLEHPPGLRVQWIRFWQEGWRRPVVSVSAAGLILFAATILLWQTQTEGRAGPVMTCKVEGMMCNGCAQNVRRVLEKVPGVHRAEVDPRTGQVRLTLKQGAALSSNQLSFALSNTRFRLAEIDGASEPKKSREERR